LRSVSSFVYEWRDRSPSLWSCLFIAHSFIYGAAAPLEAIMKTTVSMLFAAAFVLSSVPAHAVVLDLSTLTCKQFVEGGDDEIKMVLTWMDGWYKGDQDEAIIDTDVFVENAKKFGQFCAANPTISIVNAAEKILGK
jgi:acid stress chaperone HdeB